MYICMYVYMYVCTDVRTYICIYVRHIYVCMCVYLVIMENTNLPYQVVSTEQAIDVDIPTSIQT